MSLTGFVGHQVHSASAYCDLMLIYVGKIWRHLQKHKLLNKYHKSIKSLIYMRNSNGSSSLSHAMPLVTSS